MISVLLTICVMAMVGIIGPLVGLAVKSQSTYGSDLEQYITSRNPQDTADVERIAREYDQKVQRNFL